MHNTCPSSSEEEIIDISSSDEESIEIPLPANAAVALGNNNQNQAAGGGNGNLNNGQIALPAREGTPPPVPVDDNDPLNLNLFGDNPFGDNPFGNNPFDNNSILGNPLEGALEPRYASRLRPQPAPDVEIPPLTLGEAYHVESPEERVLSKYKNLSEMRRREQEEILQAQARLREAHLQYVRLRHAYQQQVQMSRHLELLNRAANYNRRLGSAVDLSLYINVPRVRTAEQLQQNVISTLQSHQRQYPSARAYVTNHGIGPLSTEGGRLLTAEEVLFPLVFGGQLTAERCRNGVIIYRLGSNGQ